MSLSREEIEKIVGDFDKISSRTEKKVAAMNMKMVILIITIIIIAIAVGYYLYLRRGKLAVGGAAGEMAGGPAPVAADKISAGAANSLPAGLSVPAIPRSEKKSILTQ